MFLLGSRSYGSGAIAATTNQFTDQDRSSRHHPSSFNPNQSAACSMALRRQALLSGARRSCRCTGIFPSLDFRFRVHNVRGAGGNHPNLCGRGGPPVEEAHCSSRPHSTSLVSDRVNSQRCRSSRPIPSRTEWIGCKSFPKQLADAAGGSEPRPQSGARRSPVFSPQDRHLTNHRGEM